MAASGRLSMLGFRRPASQRSGMEVGTCVVTGATSGIGRATALGLAARGARLVLLCRDRGRADDLRRELEARSGRDDARVVMADLSRLAEIRRAADEILAVAPRIDVLVNNASIVNVRREVTPDGFEATFAVNHLAYFLLTALLLDRLRESAPSRIVNVASDAHRFRGFDLEDLQFERRRYSWMAAYAQSKRCNVMFTRALARRLAGSGVTVNALHPGAVGTRLARNNGWWAVWITRLLSPFLRSPEQGAETSLHVATAPELAGVSGRYFANCREVRPSRLAEDDAAAQRLWELSAAATGLPA